MRKLDCSINKLTSLQKLPNTLQTLDCDHNKLTELPNSLLNCTNLTYIDYINNEIELTLQQIRFINRIRNRQQTINNIYKDSQNVHNSHIQLCLLNSINNLLVN